MSGFEDLVATVDKRLALLDDIKRNCANLASSDFDLIKEAVGKGHWVQLRILNFYHCVHVRDG
jgi:hypothetical protein